MFQNVLENYCRDILDALTLKITWNYIEQISFCPKFDQFKLCLIFIFNNLPRNASTKKTITCGQVFS